MFIQKKIFLSVLLVLASCAESFALTIDNLRVQALLNPSGIDQSNLQFSWQLQSAERGVVQTSYHLVLTKDTAGEDVVFDSGVVQSEQSVGVEVNSLALQPAQRYYWHVTVQDNKGQTATSTEPAYFETGLMGTGWSGAKWIEASDVPAGEATNEVTDYTVEGKVRIEHTAAGLCFAMQDNSNFYFWQLNTEGDYPRLRPHVWKNGNPSCLDNINLTGKVALNNTDEFTLRIEVTGATRARTYINNVLVDDRAGDFKFGRIGMREDHGERDGKAEIGVYDDIRVTTASGTVLLSEDFEQGNTFSGGTITGGKLRIVGSTNGHVLVWQKQTDGTHVHYALDWDMYLVKAQLSSSLPHRQIPTTCGK